MTSELDSREVTMSQTVIVMMTREEAQEAMDRFRAMESEYLDKARAILLELHEREGWKAMGYDTWESFGKAMFGKKRSQLYRMLDAAKVERNLLPQGSPMSTNGRQVGGECPPMGDKNDGECESMVQPSEMSPIGGQNSTLPIAAPIPERHLRPLAKLSPEQQRQAWQAAHQASEGKPTARHTEEAAKAIAGEPNMSVADIAKHVEQNLHKSKPPKLTDDALYRHEQRIAEELQAIQSQKLWCKVAESYEDYLDGLIERMKPEEK